MCTLDIQLQFITSRDIIILVKKYVRTQSVAPIIKNYFLLVLGVVATRAFVILVVLLKGSLCGS